MNDYSKAESILKRILNRMHKSKEGDPVWFEALMRSVFKTDLKSLEGLESSFEKILKANGGMNKSGRDIVALTREVARVKRGEFGKSFSE